MRHVYTHKIRWFITKHDKEISFTLWVLTLAIVGYVANIIGGR